MDDETLTPQRLRVVFSQSGVMRYVGHLDVARTWERALRRAAVPLAYSEGFNPQARLQFASALPLGATGVQEVVDVYLLEPLAPQMFNARVQVQLPAGLGLITAQEVPYKGPALQALLRQSDWQVDVETAEGSHQLEQRVQRLLASAQVHITRQRKGREEVLDLRPLVLELAYQGTSTAGWHRLQMRLRTDPTASARPDQVLAALGLLGGEKAQGQEASAYRMHRLRCWFASAAQHLTSDVFAV